jgi:hypothetical protein
MKHYRNGLQIALRGLSPDEQLKLLEKEGIWIIEEWQKLKCSLLKAPHLTQTVNGDLKVRNAR